ncbi:MAG: tRNA pseudouridine(55) synthase TruB [Chloroflexi bacterium]|nr:MAG: tRNA pseudouridine(55) synthase TruB [Chloroflexota bacterium]
MPALPASGVLLIDKPEGWSSHDVVAYLRPLLGTRKVGHAGTLDPLASGLLVVLYGHATKLSAELHRERKTYLADLALGAETATDDREGAVTERAEVPALSDEAVRQTLAAFVGPQQQVPPAYSALHVGGQRAYDRARRGESMSLAPRAIVVYALDLVGREPARLRVRVECSAGTYVRALARDIGRRLGTRAHLGGLRRLTVGSYSIEDALTPAQAREFGAEGLAKRVMTEDAARRLLAGDRADIAPVSSATITGKGK